MTRCSPEPVIEHFGAKPLPNLDTKMECSDYCGGVIPLSRRWVLGKRPIQVSVISSLLPAGGGKCAIEDYFDDAP